MSCIFRTAALRPFLSLVLAILTAYYYALRTKLVTSLKSFQAAACEIIFWETWGQQGKVRSKHISVDSKIDQFLHFTNLLLLSSQLHFRSYDGYQALNPSQLLVLNGSTSPCLANTSTASTTRPMTRSSKSTAPWFVRKSSGISH